MTRNLTAVATLLTVGVVFAQQPMADKPKTNDKPAAGWNDKDKYPTLFPDLEPGKDFRLDDAIKKLPEVVVYESDPPLRRAAKKRFLAQMEAVRIMEKRIQAGAFMTHLYSQYTTLTASLLESAQQFEPDAEAVQRHCEFRVLLAKSAEQFMERRVKAGVEMDHQTLPVLTVERYAAEIELLKLKEKAKK